MLFFVPKKIGLGNFILKGKNDFPDHDSCLTFTIYHTWVTIIVIVVFKKMGEKIRAQMPGL